MAGSSNSDVARPVDFLSSVVPTPVTVDGVAVAFFGCFDDLATSEVSTLEAEGK